MPVAALDTPEIGTVPLENIPMITVGTLAVNCTVDVTWPLAFATVALTARPV